MRIQAKTPPPPSSSRRRTKSHPRALTLLPFHQSPSSSGVYRSCIDAAAAGRDPRALSRRRTLDSIVAQTHAITRWIIVDAGSTDATPALLAEYAEKHPFIEVVRREDRGKRSVGPGVIEAFYAGLEGVDLDDFEFVCKRVSFNVWNAFF